MMWIAHDSTRTSQVTWRQASTCPSPPHDASTPNLLLARHHRMVHRTQARAHPTPRVVGQHIGHRIRHLHITSQKIHQIHSMLSITHHPRVTTIGPHIAQFLV